MAESFVLYTVIPSAAEGSLFVAIEYIKTDSEGDCSFCNQKEPKSFGGGKLAQLHLVLNGIYEKGARTVPPPNPQVFGMRM